MDLVLFAGQTLTAKSSKLFLKVKLNKSVNFVSFDYFQWNKCGRAFLQTEIRKSLGIMFSSFNYCTIQACLSVRAEVFSMLLGLLICQDCHLGQICMSWKMFNMHIYLLMFCDKVCIHFRERHKCDLKMNFTSYKSFFISFNYTE